MWFILQLFPCEFVLWIIEHRCELFRFLSLFNLCCNNIRGLACSRSRLELVFQNGCVTYPASIVIFNSCCGINVTNPTSFWYPGFVLWYGNDLSYFLSSGQQRRTCVKSALSVDSHALNLSTGQRWSPWFIFLLWHSLYGAFLAGVRPSHQIWAQYVVLHPLSDLFI